MSLKITQLFSNPSGFFISFSTREKQSGLMALHLLVESQFAEKHFAKKQTVGKRALRNFPVRNNPERNNPKHNNPERNKLGEGEMD